MVTTDRSLGASDQTLIYINDNGPISEAVPNLIFDNDGNFSSHKLYIASRAGSGFYFNGQIAQVLIYNRALTAEEIQENYAAVQLKYGLQ
ncbi:hypothetical protein GCM10026987_24650 [Belliella aquatica]|uniref:Uncharacterized protein n=1 Tax=Belliella aquatica TaxID=1323734 RepID=A0ABQ1N3S1_9BACT|nr:LamG domain-containing protein [Belliella aquatica]GGC52880.1 hypothetical protein GCM10010993_34140 [Belliella aquatica]